MLMLVWKLERIDLMGMPASCSTVSYAHIVPRPEGLHGNITRAQETMGGKPSNITGKKPYQSSKRQQRHITRSVSLTDFCSTFVHFILLFCSSDTGDLSNAKSMKDHTEQLKRLHAMDVLSMNVSKPYIQADKETAHKSEINN